MYTCSQILYRVCKNIVQGVPKYCSQCPEILFRVSRIIVQGVPKYCSGYLQILLRVIQVAHKYVHYMYRVTTNFHRISTNIVEGVFKYCTCRGFSQIFYRSFFQIVNRYCTVRQQFQNKRLKKNMNFLLYLQEYQQALINLMLPNQIPIFLYVPFIFLQRIRIRHILPGGS